MYKVISIVLVIAFVSFLAGSVLAEEDGSSSIIQFLQEQINNLKIQIQALIVQIENWTKENKKETEDTAKDVLKIIRELKRGMRGEDVELLQEMLATDPVIYPEGLTTGYYGPLTEKAVKRFQELSGIEDEDGVVGEKTLSKINELLELGAGNSGKVPPGLLISPGIKKKIAYDPEAPENQDLPPGIQKKLDKDNDDDDDDDVIIDIEAPIISDISATDVTSLSATIIWKTEEESDSKVWYDDVTPLVVDNATKIENTGLTLNHEITLLELISGMDYYFKVGSADILGNTTSSSEMLFTTPSE